MTNTSNRAATYFHGTEGYNCAQAVYKAFSDDSNTLETLKGYGGGHAPDNMCGALYAALLLLGQDEKAKALLEKAFVEHVGTTNCYTIRIQGNPSCRDCVKIAAELLETTGMTKR